MKKLVIHVIILILFISTFAKAACTGDTYTPGAASWTITQDTVCVDTIVALAESADIALNSGSLNLQNTTLILNNTGAGAVTFAVTAPLYTNATGTSNEGRTEIYNADPNNGFYINAAAATLVDMEDTDPSFGKNTDEIVMDICGDLDIPIISNFPCGHGKFQATLPISIPVELNAEGDEPSLTILESPVS